jgi:hypothetical protein
MGADVRDNTLSPGPAIPRPPWTPTPPLTTPEDVFNRIAVALERIATAIEPTAREVSARSEPDPED